MKTIDVQVLERIIAGAGSEDFAKEAGRMYGWFLTVVTNYNYFAPATSIAIATGTWIATKKE